MANQLIDLGDESIKWEIINRILLEYFTSRSKYISFNIDNQIRKVDSIKIRDIVEANSYLFETFSNQVNQMPNSLIWSYSSSNLLWKSYLNIFLYAELANYDALRIIHAINFSALEKSESVFENLASKLLNPSTNKVNLQKNEIEDHINNDKEIDLEFTKGEYDYIRQWSEWKQKALLMNKAGLSSPTSMISQVSSNLNLLSEKDGDWSEIRVAKKMLKNYTIPINTMAAQSYKRYINDLDLMELEYKIIPIHFDWFVPEVFDADYWRLNPNYNGTVSDGNGNGNLPSYITDLVFLKNVKYRESTSSVWTFLERVGGLGAKLPVSDFLNREINEYWLAGCLYKKTPTCPNPNKSLIFSR